MTTTTDPATDHELPCADDPAELNRWIEELLRNWPTPMRDLIQIDGWANHRGDSVMQRDDDGDVLMWTPQRDPQRSGTTVRILIADGASRDDVLRILRKQIAWFEESTGSGSPDFGGYDINADLF